MAFIKICNNYGFYTFSVSDVYGGVSLLRQRYPDLVQIDKSTWTYPILAKLENHSIETTSYGGIIAMETYAGEPWEVMKQNGITFDVIETNKLIYLKMVLLSIADNEISFSKNYLVQDGTITPNGRIRRYTCEYESVNNRFFYYDIGVE